MPSARGPSTGRHRPPLLLGNERRIPPPRPPPQRAPPRAAAPADSSKNERHEHAIHHPRPPRDSKRRHGSKPRHATPASARPSPTTAKLQVVERCVAPPRRRSSAPRLIEPAAPGNLMIRPGPMLVQARHVPARGLGSVPLQGNQRGRDLAPGRVRDGATGSRSYCASSSIKASISSSFT